MENWKKILLKAAGFGGGFAVVGAIILGCVVWWADRPAKPKDWDKKALTSKFESMDVSNQKDVLVVTVIYSIENTTDSDYTLTNSATFMAKDKTTGDVGVDQRFIRPVDLFIPAHHKVKYDLLRFYKKPDEVTADVSTTDGVNRFVHSELDRIGAFEIFDQENKYEIVLPSGWNGWKTN